MSGQYANKTRQLSEKVDRRLIASQSGEAENWKKYIASNHCFLKGRAYLIAKRVIDVIIILMAAPFWLPIFFLSALLIKLDSPKDPVFFKQYRTGKNGRRFAMLKYRTMVTNAEELKASLADQNLLQWPDFKVLNDPRITRIGKFLRESSLDELPQLLNVLRGDMSLVGPRPTSFAAGTYELWQSERLDVTPGITGLWQILGRGRMEFTDRVRLDIHYIENRCLWLDMKLLFRTFFSLNKGF
jgi:lipopolysaccharide/colanic/teichoic acid biosynthesis glycosyltransferase